MCDVCTGEGWCVMCVPMMCTGEGQCGVCVCVLRVWVCGVCGGEGMKSI